MNDRLEKESDILSDVLWTQVFELLLFMHNDIFPSDFYEHSPDGIVKIYFQKKYKISFK